MGRKWKYFLFLLPIMALALGMRQEAPKPLAVVTRVELVSQRGDLQVRRRYTAAEKMSRVLNYLRLQKSLGKAQADPERLRGSHTRIDVILSDGSRQVYYQCCDRYLSKQYRPWQKIDPARAEEFYRTVKSTASDR